MSWVLDTCVLLDVGRDDRSFGSKSCCLTKEKLRQGLVVCLVTFVELAPALSRRIFALEDFLFQLGVDHQEDWLAKDTSSACEARSRYVQSRQEHQVAKRPIADVLIGAFALRFQGLLTGNTDDYRKLFLSLQLISP